MPANQAPDPSQPHSHEPNPHPPAADPSFVVIAPDGQQSAIEPSSLHVLPQSQAAGCYIVSTGHGVSGPFTFGGVSLLVLLEQFAGDAWHNAAVLSADGFGTRILRTELLRPDPSGPILLATRIDGRPMSRAEGLVRLIVPFERDDALRQVKWIARIELR